MEKLKTIAVNAAVIAVVSIVLIWGNTLYRQYTQFGKGEQATAEGNFLAAVAGYESALHMYSPLSPLNQRSAQRLWDIAEGAQRRGDIPRALIAYRSLRSCIFASSGLYTPGEEWIARCDTRIKGLVQAQAQQGR